MSDAAKERASLAAKEKYKANRLQIIERMKKYYVEHRMEKIAYQMKYNEENNEKYKDYYCERNKILAAERPPKPVKEPKPPKVRVSKKALILDDGTQDFKPKNISYKSRVSSTPITILEGPVLVSFA